ncbi:MAG: (2Fe-2S)-binding protein [Duganella sp.]
MTDASIELHIDTHPVRVDAGVTVAAAIAMAGSIATRRSVTGAPRAPLCGMGVCQECRVTIDGRPHRLACQTLCSSGMHVLTGGAP